MSTDPSPDDDVERLERVLLQGRGMMERLREARTEVREVSGRAHSAEDLVEVVSNGQGDVTEVRIDPRAMRLDHATLGRQVTAVLQAAQDEAARLAREIVDRALADTEGLPEPPDEHFIRDRVDQIARNCSEL
ncbi:YbaB/EbfC family nucleoid-associated protein [Streptosporangium saharense]|uniref:DNA-binding protein YbaB n=1 Tax=Streptosporangium saharense TaxID=1706840 RepID=A0A7W7QPQ7_9ACTN|nr:YbaB/EbfC family nucleoid-associated protein [Streptosporangium saharense]MBB4917378.1 DNA-binding protein YbaB [Streptosporangium saharense]